MSTFSVSALIEKSENKDKDIRHMAMWDLNNELQKDTVKLDETSQRQLAEVVLKLLDDNSSEVQGAAVRWYVLSFSVSNKIVWHHLSKR